MNTDGPSFIDEFGNFILTLPDYEVNGKKNTKIWKQEYRNWRNKNE